MIGSQLHKPEINYMKITVKNTNTRIGFVAKRLIPVEKTFTSSRQEGKLNTQGLGYMANMVGIMIPHIQEVCHNINI